MTNKFQHLPVNSDSFQELLKFGKIILNICKKLEITPIVYGSLAYFYYTQDKNISINDLDFLVPQSTFPELIKIFEKEAITYKAMQWPSIVINKNSLEIDLDSVERYLDPRSRICNKIQIENLELNILNIESLMSIYQETIDNMPQDQEFIKRRGLYKMKLKNLKKIT